jgi:ferredoxin
MITGKLKPLDEIAASISRYRKILILGCGTCVTVSLSGGDRAAEDLARELSHPRFFDGNPPDFKVDTILRQCEKDLVTAYLDIPPDTEAILSLGCGAGVQTLAEVFGTMPVIPGLNTTFLGALDEPGILREKCYGCGDCILASTGGICPVARCAKRLLNGPCGGSSNGKCEINKEVDCVWQLIIDRLKALDRLDEYEKLSPLKDWSADRGGGPRSIDKAESVPFR